MFFLIKKRFQQKKGNFRLNLKELLEEKSESLGFPLSFLKQYFILEILRKNKDKELNITSNLMKKKEIIGSSFYKLNFLELKKKKKTIKKKDKNLISNLVPFFLFFFYDSLVSKKMNLFFENVPNLICRIIKKSEGYLDETNLNKIKFMIDMFKRLIN